MNTTACLQCLGISFPAWIFVPHPSPAGALWRISGARAGAGRGTNGSTAWQRESRLGARAETGLPGAYIAVGEQRPKCLYKFFDVR